ncbi:MAG: peptidoglycan-binding protein [Clostridia bacterium]|nr:peptidoglycan-binding protein [Clostridia bacterium]
MFCSNCGKSIRPEDATCPHCGAVLGEDRFLGNMYTSSQVRLPVDALDRAPAGSLSAYTRTDYMSYDNQPEDDVYSNTTYRPLLGDDEDLSRQEQAEAAPEPEAAGEPEPEPAGESEPAGEPAPEEPEAAEPLDELEEVAESFEAEDDDGETSVSPLPEIKPRGISPAVQRYMREAEERNQNQAQRGGGLKARLPFFRRQPEPEEVEEEPAEDIPGAEAAEPAQDVAYEADDSFEPEDSGAQADSETDAGEAADVYEAPADEADDAGETEDGVYAEEGYEDDGYEDETYAEDGEDEDGERESSGFKFDLGALRKNRKLQIALAAVLVLAVLIGGVMWLVYVTSNLGSKIAGVTHNTYAEGIKLIEEYTSDNYRSQLVEVGSTNMDYARQRMSEDMAKLNALLPEEPQENDQLFVTTLTILDEGVQSVIKKDAEAVYSGTQAEREAASQQEWSVVQNAVTQLKNATTATQLTALAGDIQTAVIPQPTVAPTPVAPTPSPEPTPVVIQEGLKDNDEVLRMQKRLIELGYLTGKADGDFGPKTGAALKAFQQAAGLQADGIATEAVLEALYADDAPAATPAPDQAGLAVIEV